MSKILNLGNGFIQVDSFVVEKKVLDVIDRIRDYDPNLDVLYLNPDRVPELLDEPWVIVENCKDGQVRKVFGCYEMNDSVFERLVACDTARSDILTNIDVFNTKLRQESQRRYDEKRQEAGDKLAHLLAYPKTTYKLETSDGTLLTIDDKLGVVKREGGEE